METEDTMLESIFSAAGGNAELETMLEAIMGGHEKPAEIAEATGIDVKRVYQLRRTLQRRLQAREGAHDG
jgi:hypothetical protein